MAGWLIKKGVAGSRFVANLELLLIALIFFWLSPLMFILL
jgi:hypothetical protein